MTNPSEPRPAIVQAAEDLAALAQRINAREKKSRRATIEHVRHQGKDLLVAKKLCKRGAWLKWCKDNLEIGRTQIWYPFTGRGVTSVQRGAEAEKYTNREGHPKVARWGRLMGGVRRQHPSGVARHARAGRGSRG
jgi:hypothetical protein